MHQLMESSPEWYWIEVALAAKKLVEEVFPIRPGENVVVSLDTISDYRVAEEVMKAVYAVGAIPVLVIHPVTRVATSDPPRPAAAAILAADAWFEFEEPYYLLYSDVWKKAMKAGVRMLCIGGTVDNLVKMVGRTNYAAMDKFANKLVELCVKARELHITSAEGTDLRFQIDPKGAFGHVIREGCANANFEGPGITQTPPGACNIGHVPDTVEGALVFDGCILPPDEIGVLRETVRLEIHKGKITKVSGGQEARVFEKWLSSFNHPGMFEMAHCGTFGFNPGISRCKGELSHDERVWGGMEFGIGPKFADAPGHTDGVVYNTSVWADDVQLEDKGRYVHPELVELCRAMGVDGY